MTIFCALCKEMCSCAHIFGGICFVKLLFSYVNVKRYRYPATPPIFSDLVLIMCFFTDLRTNDTEERIKRENNFETLRRLAHVNAVATGGTGPGGVLTERESQQLATIQKMDMLRQAAVVGRDHFLGGRGGFGAPLTAPLGIPASDLARIAQTVPDPAAASGEPTSGTGRKNDSVHQCFPSVL